MRHRLECGGRSHRFSTSRKRRPCRRTPNLFAILDHLRPAQSRVRRDALTGDMPRMHASASLTALAQESDEHARRFGGITAPLPLRPDDPRDVGAAVGDRRLCMSDGNTIRANHPVQPSIVRSAKRDRIGQSGNGRRRRPAGEFVQRRIGEDRKQLLRVIGPHRLESDQLALRFLNFAAR